MTTNPKKIAGERAAEYLAHDMIVGLGTGSTAYFAIVRLGERIRDEGLRIRCIATSERSAALARGTGRPVDELRRGASRRRDHRPAPTRWNPAFNLVKGGGGALLREKFVASASEAELIIVDESKLKQRLGAFPLPVEVVPFGWQLTRERLQGLGCEATFRSSDDRPFVTDNGNYIVDCAFGVIQDPPALERRIVGTCGGGGMRHLCRTRHPRHHRQGRWKRGRAKPSPAACSGVSG